jgi:hypothetical protein
LNLNLVVLWTDQSRRPSAINAPSHHGFGPYRHFKLSMARCPRRFNFLPFKDNPSRNLSAS